MIKLSVIVLFFTVLQACVTTQDNKPRNDKKAARFNAQLGINYMNKQHNLDQARIKLEKALEQDESNALAHAGYAQLQSIVGDKKKAKIHYQRAIALAPLNANHKNAYAVFLCSEGEVEESITVFDEAIENRYYKTPEYALDNAGVCLLDSEKTAKAEDYLARAIKINPRYAPSLLNLADLNLRNNQFDIAKAYYLRYEKLGRSSPRSLWVGYRVMSALGDKGSASTLSNTLLRKFPNSKQAGELLMIPGDE